MKTIQKYLKFGDQEKLERKHVSRKVTHVPVGTTQQMKMSCAAFKATTENPLMAPFAKGGGPKDRGFLPLIGIFIRDAKTRSSESSEDIVNFAPWRLGGINFPGVALFKIS